MSGALERAAARLQARRSTLLEELAETEELLLAAQASLASSLCVCGHRTIWHSHPVGGPCRLCGCIACRTVAVAPSAPAADPEPPAFRVDTPAVPPLAPAAAAAPAASVSKVAPKAPSPPRTCADCGEPVARAGTRGGRHPERCASCAEKHKRAGDRERARERFERKKAAAGGEAEPPHASTVEPAAKSQSITAEAETWIAKRFGGNGGAGTAELVAALVRFGYHAPEARYAVEQARREEGSMARAAVVARRAVEMLVESGAERSPLREAV